MSSKQERQQAILKEMRLRTGEPVTKTELAQALGRSPGQAFDLDLAAARHLALDAGEEITNCHYNREVDAWVMYHLTADTEAEKAALPLGAVVGQARTRLHNIKRHAGFLAKNGALREDRRYGKMVVEMTSGVEHFMATLTMLEADIKERLAAVDKAS